MSQISRETLQQQFKVTNYIGLAMIGSVFIYAAIVLAIDHGYVPLGIPPAANNPVFTQLKYILLIISIIFYFIIRLLQNRLPKFLKNQPRAGILPTVSLITWALCEAVAIYGLVLFILTWNRNDFFLFMAISLLYFYLFYPKYADWERLLSQDSVNSPG